MSNKIKEFRVKRQMSVYKLADIANLSPAYISNLENNHKSNPTKDVMDKLAEALTTTVTDLFY